MSKRAAYFRPIGLNHATRFRMIGLKRAARFFRISKARSLKLRGCARGIRVAG